MNYKEMKKLDLATLTSREKAEEMKSQIMDSDKDDIIKYINYLRYIQYNEVDLNYMQYIINFMYLKELQNIEFDNPDIKFGEVEELIIHEIIVSPENQISINEEDYIINAVLIDSYETVLIATDSNEKFRKFGYITDKDGINFIYELVSNEIIEDDNYFNQIINAEIETKVNILSMYVGLNEIVKTFEKIEINVENLEFAYSEKTTQGVISNVVGGMILILKKPEILIIPKIEIQKNNPQESPQDQDTQENTQDTNEPSLDEVFDDEENKDEETKENDKKIDYTDVNFKFSEKYHFEITSGQDKIVTELRFNGKKEDLEYDENNKLHVYYDYVDEVYNFILSNFTKTEDMEGVWVISNSDIEKIVRKLIYSGAVVKLEKDIQIGSFLSQFKKNQFEKMNNTKIEFIQSFKTLDEIYTFAKENGTEHYVKSNQINIAILDAVKQKWDCDDYVVYDSSSKMIICKVENKDEEELKCFGEINKFDTVYISTDKVFTAHNI